ncbi:hypothetical protein SNE40_010023 [Patella caerulea]|uniref:MAM domain-containing protein n=1 Tax=Patella caerulea TaxID=87958 RepID=A0AAN8Q415_PATCE
MPESGRSTFENCDYQSGNCGWHNVQSDDFDWVLGTGAAPSKMGPSHDHTTENYDKSGHYVYMQSSGQSPGNIAILESSVFRVPPFSNGQCKVRFFYHMYGKHVFRLQLDVREVCREANVSRTIIWNRFRRVKRNEWVYYVAPLVNISGSFVLRFTAFVGYLSEKGDIAVDDISLSPECFSSGNRFLL